MDYDIPSLLKYPDKIVEEAIEQAKISSDFSDVEVGKILENKFLNLFGQKGNAFYFGSRVFGLSSINSDLDIFLDFAASDESNFYADKNRKYDSYFLDRIRSSLLDDKKWHVKLFLPNASVPLLKAYYIPDDIQVDIIASNGIGVENSWLIKHFVDIQPEFRSLFLFIRMWLECNGISFKNYTLVLLVIFFLQRTNFLPSVERVQRNLEVERIDGWNVAFDDKRRLCSYGTKKIRDFQILVLDFFLFYSKYNFDVYVMSTHFGCSFIRSNYTYPNFIVGKPMCVAGLLSQNYNCACHVSKKNLSDFINVCNISVEMLNANGF